MRKIFLSFNSLLNLINMGAISHADMAHGFYMFGCSRALAMDPAPRDREEKRDWLKHGKQAYEMMLPHLLKAEKEGRVIWMSKKDGQFRVVNKDFNEMLKKHKMPEVVFPPGVCIPLHYPTTEKLLVDLGVQLAPIYFTNMVL